jgi:hypothetical protein
MDPKKAAELAAPRKLGAYLARKPAVSHMGHGRTGVVSSLREDEHNGHKISILTTYRIEVDGKLIRAPLSVDGLGRVHCHSLPNYITSSAVDLVKVLIDSFPEEFTKRPPATKTRKTQVKATKTTKRKR